MLSGCGSPRKVNTEAPEASAPAAAETAQNAYQIELKRNWNFGFENYKNHRYQEVPHFFWRVVEMDTAKTFVDVYSFLANTYLQLDKSDSALWVYQRGMEAFPANSNLLRDVANFFVLENRPLEAIEKYQQLVAINTAEEKDYRRLAELCLANADTAQAIAALEKLQDMVPQDLEVRQLLSRLYPAGNHRADADVQQLEFRQLQSPKDPQTLLALGKTYFHRNEFAKSAAMIEQYLEIVPADSYAREYLGRGYVELQRFDEAITQFNMVLATSPKHPEALALISKCHLALQQYALARRSAHRALEVDGKYGFAYIVLGEIYVKAAQHCSDASAFSQKLVFRLAYEQYEKALFDDIWQGEARRRMKALEPLLPHAKDYFMNKNQDRPEGECFEWIYQ